MESLERRFAETLAARIASLPYDLKICFALLADADQPDAVRKLAASAAVYVLGPNDIIPDRLLPVGYADDAILLWSLLARLQQDYPETAQKFSERFEEQFAEAADTVAIFRDYLGDLYDWLADKLPGLDHLVYKGKSAAQYAEDSDAANFLYEEGQAFVTDFDLDEAYLSRRLTAQKVRAALRERAEAERRRL